MMLIKAILALSLASLSLAAPANEPRQLGGTGIIPGGVLPGGGDNPLSGIGGSGLLDGVPLIGPLLGGVKAK